ncbi:MAG: universal stress protein [Nitrospirae bacterium]|nr:universal stress protein [Nitrospirota bacterium]
MDLKDRHILIAIDESENAKRAVLYVADVIGGFPGFRVTLLTIIPEPPEDYFKTPVDRRECIDSQRHKTEQMLENYRQILIQSGFSEGKVSVKLNIKDCPSVAECILDELKELKACTVVIGRRGISKKEEFLFGSTSSKIIHYAKNCSVWVIE